jgi:hypothetical protein
MHLGSKDERVYERPLAVTLTVLVVIGALMVAAHRHNRAERRHGHGGPGAIGRKPAATA